jgi:hypothetical protein
VDLVIARYKEPLNWIDEYKDRGFRKIHIYNKSDKEVQCPTFAKGSRTKCVLHNIENVGVCDHTYLYHIVHSYDTLADVTIFAPGSADIDFKNTILDFTIGRAFETKNTVMNVFRFDIGAGEAMYKFTMETYPTAYKDNRDGTDERVEQKLAEIRPFGAWYEGNFPGEQPKEASFFGIMAMSKEEKSWGKESKELGAPPPRSSLLPLRCGQLSHKRRRPSRHRPVSEPILWPNDD